MRVRHRQRLYPGYDNDPNLGMSQEAKLIRQAWAFDLLPESEKCVNWRVDQFEELWDKVNSVWEKAEFRLENLPDEVQKRYMDLQNSAFEAARQQGWDPNKLIEDDE